MEDELENPAGSGFLFSDFTPTSIYPISVPSSDTGANCGTGNFQRLFTDFINIQRGSGNRSGNCYFITDITGHFFGIIYGVHFVSHYKDRGVPFLNALFSAGSVSIIITLSAAMGITDVSSPGAFIGGECRKGAKNDK
jgi:hypothetical protein